MCSSDLYDLLQTPTISADQAEFLLQAARDLNEVEDLHRRAERRVADDAAQRVARLRPQRGQASGVIDLWNDKHPVDGELAKRSYDVRGREFTRPGKAFHDGTSGVIVRCDDGRDRSIHYSTNDPLWSDEFGDTTSCGICDGFDVMRLLDHRGDFRAAVRAAAIELGIQHRSDNDLMRVVLYAVDANEFAALYEGDLTSVGGDVDAAVERLGAILRKHSQSEEQIVRLIAKSKVPFDREDDR